MFKNAVFFRMGATDIDFDQVEEAMKTHAFAKPQALEAQTVGFVAPFEDSGLLYRVPETDFRTFCIRVDSRNPHASTVREMVRERVADVEQNQGYKPGRKQRNEIKERVIDELLPKTQPSTRYIRAYLTPQFLIVDAVSGTATDTVIGLLARAMNDADVLALNRVYLKRSPSEVMSGWLSTDEEPDAFTIDDFAMLYAPGSEGGKITLKNTDPASVQVREYIGKGFKVERLGMTYNDRLSFVIDGSFKMRSIKPLDVLTQTGEGMTSEESRDATLYALLSELLQVFASLADAMGGERE
jgi:recombination associated protein RdgC